MDMSEIKQAVMRGDFTTSELQSLISYTRTVMETQTKATLNVGDDVWVVQKTKRTPGVIVRNQCYLDCCRLKHLVRSKCCTQDTEADPFTSDLAAH